MNNLHPSGILFVFLTLTELDHLIYKISPMKMANTITEICEKSIAL